MRFESGMVVGAGGRTRQDAPDDTLGLVRDVLGRLRTMDGAAGSDPARVEAIGLLEQVKAAAAAAQARVMVRFDHSQRQAQSAAGVPAAKLGRGVADQIALARHLSPRQGSIQLGLAHILVTEMPYSLDLLADGGISEWAAQLLVTETATTSIDTRARVDRHLCVRETTTDPATGEMASRPARAEGMSAWRIGVEARKLVMAWDPASVAARRRVDVDQRRVSLRPVPDVMGRLSATVPVGQGVACWAALNQAARSLQAKGDPRSLDQIRADLLVTRITGQAEADAVSFHVNLVMPADSLLGPDQTHAYATGQGRPGTHSRPSSEDRHGLQDADGQTYADADADPDADADCHADPDADPDADADGHDYADGDADAETWPDHATHPDHATVRDEPVDLGYPDCPTWDARGETWDARWDEPAHLDGIGPITAATARALIRETPAQVWIRRLFLDPVSGIADNIDPRARNFPLRLRQLIIARDRTCRHPYCDAPIREIDHITAWTDGGTTTPDNGQGLCKRCNLVKTMPGWTTQAPQPPQTPRHRDIVPASFDHAASDPPDPRSASPTRRQAIGRQGFGRQGHGTSRRDAAELPAQSGPDLATSHQIVTPTGHRYRSNAPPLRVR